MTLRVLTLNLWNRSGAYDLRAPLIREAVRTHAPDLIGFQEVLRSSGGDQASELLADLGYEVAYGEAGAFWTDPEQGIGNAVAARWPIEDAETLRLPDGDGPGRVAVCASIAAPFGRVAFTSTHLNWRPDDGWARERQVVALAELIARRSPAGGFPPILVGDLNASPDATEIRFLRGRHALEGRSAYFVDAWAAAGDGTPGHTWSRRNAHIGEVLERDRRVDYVLVGLPRSDGCGLVERCRLVCDEPSEDTWPSDHFGVLAEVRTAPVEPSR